MTLRLSSAAPSDDALLKVWGVLLDSAQPAQFLLSVNVLLYTASQVAECVIVSNSSCKVYESADHCMVLLDILITCPLTGWLLKATLAHARTKLSHSGLVYADCCKRSRKVSALHASIIV